MTYRRVENRWDKSSGEALTPCSPKMEDMDDLELEKLEAVDRERVQYHCGATILVPHKREHSQPCKVGAVLDSGAGVFCISKGMANDLGSHLEGTRIVFPIQKLARARVADGQELAIRNQTRRISVAILMPWAPVEVTVSLAPLPGIVDVLVICSLRMGKRLGVDAMASLNDIIARGTKDRCMPPDDMADVAVVTKEAQITQNRMSKLGPVGVTLEGMRTAGKRKALPEAQDGIRKESIARSSVMFMLLAEEGEAPTEALQKTLDTAVMARTRRRYSLRVKWC